MNSEQITTLKGYRLIHSDERSIECRSDDNVSRTSDNCEVREWNHSNVKRFCCKLCHKMFQFKTGLAHYKQKHSGLKTFKCEVCYKPFSCKLYLNEHKLNHTGNNN